MASHPLRTLRMQLNTFYSGPQAWFFLAAERGYLRNEGLAVEVTATGTSCPLLKNGMYEVITSIATGITPLIKSVVIGAPPR